MKWKPSKLGSIVLLFGAFFAVCEVYGTYSFFIAQQGGLDYIVLLGCGVAASVPILPPVADVASRRGWRGPRWSLWLALPLALVVVVAAALQRTGSSTDTQEQDRSKSRAGLELATQTKQEAEAEIRKLGRVRPLADIETDIAKAKLNPLYSRSSHCTDATAKPSRALCSEVAELQGEKAKAVEVAKHRKAITDARAKIAAGSGGSVDSLAYRISGYTGGAVSEEQVRLWQPLFIPILATWLSAAFLTVGMRLDFHVQEDQPRAQRSPVHPPEPVRSEPTAPVRQKPTAPVATNVLQMPPRPAPEPKIDANPLVLYMAAHVPEARGQNADCGEMMKGFRVWCAQQDPPIETMDAESFGLALMAICQKADIKILNKNGRAYCVGRRIVA